MAAQTKSSAAKGNGAPPTVAPRPPVVAPGGSPPGIPVAPATASAPKKAGGRPRKDGLPPGSPEADAANKKYDSERHKLARETAATVAEPPALPSAFAPGAGPGPATAPPLSVDGGDQAPPPVPWQAETLTGLVDELIEAAEENRVGSYIAKCAEAGLTPKLCKDIEADAHFPKVAKTLLKHSIPRLAAKWLNRACLSSEWQEEISVLTAIILIVKQQAKVNARFEELIQAKNNPPEPVKKNLEVKT